MKEYTERVSKNCEHSWTGDEKKKLTNKIAVLIMNTLVACYVCVCVRTELSNKKRYTRTLTIHVLFHILFQTIWTMLSSHIHTCANIERFWQPDRSRLRGVYGFHCLCYVHFSFTTRVFQCNRCTTFIHIFPLKCFFLSLLLLLFVCLFF